MELLQRMNNQQLYAEQQKYNLDLLKFANGRIVIALEGEYNLLTIPQSMLSCLKALLMTPIEIPKINSNVSNIVIKAINETKKAYKLYWNFLKNLNN